MKKNGTGPVAYSYLRFSSPEQAKGDSVRRQTALRDSWLQRHGIPLDTSLTLRDEGISGFSGKHRENPDRHALATFLGLVQAGRIARGSYLVVESLDRLTREHIRPALTLLLNLIDHGIRIVQLLPAEAVYDEDVEPMTLMMAIMELSRGHSESRMKSERVGEAWKAKRGRALSFKEVLTKKVPGWLRADKGVFVVRETAADAVRRIYRLAIDGYGLGSIVRLLNAEKVPTIGRAGYWARSYVAKILAGRAVLGEYQPHTIAGGQKRTPDGLPIAGYFPPILTEDEWYAARAALANRRRKVGRKMKGTVNLFANLLRDARDGGSIIVWDKGKKGGGKILGSYRAAQGANGTKFVSFPFDVFERAILSQLKEIDPKDVLPRQPKTEDIVLQLTGRLVAIEGRLEKIKAALLTHDDIDALVNVASTLEDERRAVTVNLAAARREASVPLSAAWGSCRSLIDVLDDQPNDEDLRIRLRAAIRRIVSDVWCLFLGKGRKRLAFVQVRFHGAEIHRDYVIVHHPEHAGFNGRQPKRTIVRSMRYAGSLDLREQTCVPVIERYVDEMFE